MRGSSRVSSLHVPRVRELAHPASHLAVTGLGVAPLLDELCEAMQAENAVAYRPELYEHGWDLEFAHWVGSDAEGREAAHRRHVQTSDANEPSFAAYDPFAVQESQQNRALTLQQLTLLERGAAQRHRQVYAALGLSGEQQLRMLVCEGPRLLGWVGVLREEPFGAREVAQLERLSGVLRRRLLAARQLGSVSVSNPLIESVLDALHQPALLFSGKGRVEYENQHARELLTRPGGRELYASLRRAVAQQGTVPGFTLAPLAGFPSYTLALYTAHQRPIAHALERARTAWKLNARAATFLEHLANGLSNKEIAAKVGCAEVTVEKQLTQLYRSSNTRSRTELMARLHAL